jgi:uncharacterized protein (TIGR02284 family)
MKDEKTVEILNDLVRINNDRVEGYRKARGEAQDLDVELKSTFGSMEKESEGYKQELIDHIRRHGGEVATGTTTSGKIYRAWMDVKATFTGHDRKAILESCEFGEDAAQRAYESALGDDGLDPDCRKLVSEQQQSLKNSHDLIKRYRDSHNSVK